MNPLEYLFLFLCGHALADFGLQTELLAKGKNRHNKVSYIPQGQLYTPTWFYSLGAHSLIHGLMVYLIADSSLILGLAETVSHFWIDYFKGEGVTNPHQDQALHLLMKVVYVILVALR